MSESIERREDPGVDQDPTLDDRSLGDRTVVDLEHLTPQMLVEEIPPIVILSEEQARRLGELAERGPSKLKP